MMSNDQAVQQAEPLVRYVHVLIPRPLNRLLTYRVVDDHIRSPHQRGECVWVPLGQSEVIGCIWGVVPEHEVLEEPKRFEKCREVILRLHWLPKLSRSLCALIDTLAEYYHVTRGEALTLALPSFDTQRRFLFTSPAQLMNQRAARDQEARERALAKKLRDERGRQASQQLDAQLTLFVSDEAPLQEVSQEVNQEGEDRSGQRSETEHLSLEEIPLQATVMDLLEALSHGGPLSLSTLPIYLSKQEWALLTQIGVIRAFECPPRRGDVTHRIRLLSNVTWPSERRERVERRVFQHLDAQGGESISLIELKDASLCADYARLRKALRALLEWDLIAIELVIDSPETHTTLAPAQLDPLGETEQLEASLVVTRGPHDITLTSEQRLAIHQVRSGKGFQTYLLYGVTGSGKTEVYLRLIEDVLARGKQALVLVPEIGLTPQTVRRFEERFSVPIYSWHSQLSSSSRLEVWGAVGSHESCVLIGARSALFTPLPNLDLIIVDESHDGSYKQGDGVRYHARDMAISRASQIGCPIVLGSATPSLESMYNAQRGKYHLLQLTERPRGASLPQVRTVDLTTSRAVSPSAQALTYTLANAISERLKRHEQVILFLNRRGFSQSVRCTDCGFLFSCPRCALALPWHRQTARLCCHHCDFSSPTPPLCPMCGERDSFALLGKGTERIEEQLRSLFSQAHIKRLDRDSELKPQELQSVMEEEGVDILIGTQMVTKGHDFPRVTLVGVIDADVGLDLPDFRVNERSYQLLSQVAGRAGRAALEGEVIVQTYRPQEERLLSAITHDYGRFYLHELALRKAINYPPFSYLATIRLQSEGDYDIREALEKLSGSLSELQGVSIRGPSPAPLSQLHGQQRWITLLLSQDRAALHRGLGRIRGQWGRKIGRARMVIDVDPHDFS